MKANEFVKKHGLNKAKVLLSTQGKTIANLKSEYTAEQLKEYQVYIVSDDLMSFVELKRLVEAHELVEKAGGFDESKDILWNVKPWSAGYNILSKTYFSGDIFSIDQEFYISDLFEAIKLVESCQ